MTYLVECRSCQTVFFAIVAAFCTGGQIILRLSAHAPATRYATIRIQSFGGEREYSRKFSDDIDAISLDESRPKCFHVMVILDLRSQVGIREELFAYFV